MKSFFKNLIASIVLVFSVSSGYAQIPVTDVAAIKESIAQQLVNAASWVSQYNQMISQYQNQIAQIKALTGGRGMGGLLANMTRQALPGDFLTSFDALRSGNPSSAATAIYDTIKTFDCSQQFPTDLASRKSCQALAMAAPQHIAMINDGITASKTRQEQIKTLLTNIDIADDAKAAADLQNRIQGEIALLSNEKQMMDMAIELNKQQLLLTKRQSSEIGKKRMQGDGSLTNPFTLN